MEVDSTLSNKRSHLLHGLDDPCFVVGKHYGDKNGVVAKGLLELSGINGTIRPNVEICDLEPVSLQAFTGSEYGGMLNAGSDQVLSLLLSSQRYSFDSKIIGFRASACENNLSRRCVNQRGYLPPSLLQSCSCPLSKGMNR